MQNSVRNRHFVPDSDQRYREIVKTMPNITSVLIKPGSLCSDYQKMTDLYCQFKRERSMIMIAVTTTIMFFTLFFWSVTKLYKNTTGDNLLHWIWLSK